MQHYNLKELLSRIESDGEVAARLDMKEVWITERELHSDLTEEKVERLVRFVCDFMDLGDYPEIIVHSEDSEEEFGEPHKLSGVWLLSHFSYNRRKLVYLDEESRIRFLRGLVHEARYLKQPYFHLFDRRGPVLELTPMEIDAEAFAILFCEYFLDVHPLCDSSELGKKLTEKIESMRSVFRNTILDQRKEGRY